MSSSSRQASLAAYIGAAEPVQTHVVCIDPAVQWSQFWNIWYNAAIRTFLYRLLMPLRWMLAYIAGISPSDGSTTRWLNL